MSADPVTVADLRPVDLFDDIGDDALAEWAAVAQARNVEPGEYVSPGVPLLSLYDLNDVWLRVNLREDLVKGLKVGDSLPAATFRVMTPDGPAHGEVKSITFE